MADLIIDYALNTRRPGYRFKPPVEHIDERTRKTIWRSVMPRGQGWRNYIGARSLKCFPVDNRRMAICDINVTPQQDEGGRRGIRQAEISIIPIPQYHDYLRERLAAYTPALRYAGKKQLKPGRWFKIIERAMPKLRGNAQVVLAHPYTDPQAWELIEYLAIYLTTTWSLHMVKGWIGATSLTTFALDASEESHIVALPLDKAQGMKDVLVIK